ncbi:MAG: hypothetical protein JNK99_02270 [Candidatus Accumulibacter sp.]|uniref:XDD4 family exosortase-dependent surface protein n=1 Tax=Accumulibacter sp. TaxID=2053492 RepID=UPI001A5BC1FE|nr:XDD4 family exosortase-dependent surface protein [Accumulibacter sp.]MBL8393563.1 hypothetical protein [Accumulibacter sp.]
MSTYVPRPHCPAQLKRLVLALGGHIEHPADLSQRQTAEGSARLQPPFLKRPLMLGMTAVGMALAIPTAWAEVICIGSGLSPEGTGTTVQGQATFTVAPGTLTVVLKNTSATTPKQADMLTGVVFNITGNPTLSYNATANPTLPVGSNIWVTPGPVINNATPLFNGSGSSWTDQLSSFTYGAYGVATTGWSGLFNAGSIAVGNGGPNYGIAAAGSGSAVSGGQAYPLAEDSLQFVFTTSGSFTQADIKDVKFLFGTAGTTSTGVPPQNCVETDFGDAPDPSLGTAAGTASTPPNYKTTLADGGASHVLGQPVYLGTIPPDGDNGALQNNTATADDLTDADDEDGVDLKNLPTLLTTTTSVKMSVKATNGTTSAAKLACWIDFNRNGIFGDAGELASATVPAATAAGTSFALTFSGFTTPLTPGPTAMRCRISTDAAWMATVAPASPAGSIGPATNGEVEDYMVNGIYDPCTTSPITSLPGDPAVPPAYYSGVQFTVSPSGSMSNIASIQCQKTINIDPTTGMTFNPVATTGPLGTPPTWTFVPSAPNVIVTARKMSTATATIACTATDSLGLTCATDPWFATAIRLTGSAKNATTEATASQLVKASSAEDHVTVTNGTPGVQKLELNVNGTKFNVNSLKDGEVRTLCITSAMRNGEENSIYLVAKGKPGGSADVMGQGGKCN